MPTRNLEDSKDRDLVKLLQDLVQIPSWVADKEDEKLIHNENKVVDFLENWIKNNTSFRVERQSLEGGRYNLIASRGEPDLIFLAHTDTVEPSYDTPYDQFAAEIRDNKIWGRGTADMKSGVAAMLQAMSLAPDTNNIWAFFYADEEKDFLGMKGLVREYSDIRPKLIVSSDGSDLSFGHGCRGLIEFRARVRGETGHPAKGTGKSAIMRGFEGIFEFRDYLKGYIHPKMGETTLNITPVLGGQLKDGSFENGHLASVGQAANVVPDIMEFKVDIRPGTPDLEVSTAINKLRDSIEKQGLEFELVEETHNYGAWYTDLSSLKEFVEIAKEIVDGTDLQIDDPGKSGYIDLQMFWNAVGRPPAFMFGGGDGETAHKPEENISIEKLIKEKTL